MSVIDNLNKDELKLIAEELNLTVVEGAKHVELKEIIEKSEHFTNVELMKSVVNSVLSEIKSRKESEKTKLELEKIKLAQLEKELEIENIRKESALNSEFEKIKLAQLEKQLEIANIKKDSSQNNSFSGLNLESEIVTNNNLEGFIKSIKTLTIPLPTKAESLNLFFQSMEKAFRTKNVPEEFKAEILLNILGEKANNLMIYVSEEDISNYEKLKAVVLKEFQPTANECLNSFRKAQKLPSENYVQYASRLSASFEYYCQLRKVNDFKSLCELIVADKIFSSLDRELMTHIGVKQGESFFKPQELGRECDIYLSAKGRNKNEMQIFSRNVEGENKRFMGNKAQGSRFQKGASNVFLSEIKNVKCVLCRGSETHALYLCPQFKKLSVQERVNVIKINRLCFKCFLPNCNVKKCQLRNCFCGKPHNKMIHFPREEKNNFSREIRGNSESATVSYSDRSNGEQSSELSSSFPANSLGATQQIVATSFAKNKTKTVLLSTVRVLVRDKYSQWHEIRCLLDSGSQACLLTKDCVNRLQLKTEKINTVISCLNDSSMVVSGCVTATIANRDKTFERTLDMFVVKKITDFVPNKVIDVNVEVPNSIPLADYSYNIPGKIDMLLGAEIFYELLRPGQIYSQNSHLLLQNSCFGYIATGTLNQENEAKMHCGLIREEDLNVTLRKFWEIEEVNVELTKGKENEICEEHFARTHKRNGEGRYIVTMPLKDNPACLGDSRDIALKKLRSLWSRLSRDENYLNLYREFMSEYLKLGHMREVKEDKLPDATYYAPHHGIYKPEKSSTKLRVVFNCSSLTSTGISLNSLQYNGGVIQNDLFTLMVGFRQHIYALTADVKKMYRMILINPNQYCLQRILWCDRADEPPKTYELQTVTYGTVSAPFLAMRTLKQLSIDEQNNFPKASPVLRDNFYMDDALFGAESLEEAKEMQRQLISVMQKAGMEMHKWCANHPELSACSSEDYSFYNLDEIKTLGVLWMPKQDCFGFSVKVELKESYSKREVLSTIARIFDPLGLLGPIIVQAKVFMQKLWRSKIDWDDKLPDAEYSEWHKFIIALKSISNIAIERCIVTSDASVIELHGFSDASESSYGAVIYCKSTTISGKTSVKLVASKSRVAPVKSLTIPRLELSAAALLAKLMKKVLSSIKIAINRVNYWTDSTIVLAWIQKEPMDLKPFVQNRVAIVQELSAALQWHYVPSEQNPADVLSRGVNPDRLKHHELWLKGPSFLMNNDYLIQPDSELDPEQCEDFNAELKSNVRKKLIDSSLNIFSAKLDTNFVHALLNLNNNYLIILHIVSFIFRFVLNCRNPLVRKSGPLEAAELKRAEEFLLKATQREVFCEEIRRLQVNKNIKVNSQLKSLNPFLDSDGILRVGGRLGNTEFGFVKKHPAILPKKHRLTQLIINYLHKKYLHVGSTNLLNHVRENFWPISGRSICRKIVHECQTCFKTNPIVSSQLMGDLPRDRVIIDFPFNCTGVDLCGPFTIKIGNPRKPILQKLYVCIFICFVFKAVHIETVSDLTSESFIAALKRFVARRGKCAKLYSDNATNFVGANKEIRKFHELIKNPNEKLAGYLSSEGIEWKFIPPRAPNFGGLWEAAVKSFKYHFKRVVGSSNLNYEEFLTLVIQIEGILNARPLSPLSASEEDFGALTPAHFLINRSLNTIIEPDLTNLKENRLNKWQKITKIVQIVWRKWHRSYLSELQQRNKWRFEKDNIQIGDLVLLIDENLPVNTWHLGRIVDVHCGEDKKVRVVQVRTKGGTFKRSVSKIALLPMPQ